MSYTDYHTTHVQVELRITSTLLEGLLEATDGGLSHETLAEVDDVRRQGVLREGGVSGTYMEKFQEFIYLPTGTQWISEGGGRAGQRGEGHVGYWRKKPP